MEKRFSFTTRNNWIDNKPKISLENMSQLWSHMVVDKKNLKNIFLKLKNNLIYYLQWVSNRYIIM